MELEPEDVSLLERCPHFEACYKQMTNIPVCSQACILAHNLWQAGGLVPQAIGG